MSKRVAPAVLSGLLALALAFGLGAAGCDSQSAGDVLSEGRQLEVEEHSPSQPSSLREYAEMGAIGSFNRVWLYRLGSGPADPPRLVRSIKVPIVITNQAQVDARGYVWVTAPDLSRSGVHRQMYVVDPHAGTIHRAIDLPGELRAAADLSIYDEGVFVRAWRNGFSGGIGRVDPDCPVDPLRCEAVLLTELGNVGGSFNPSIVLHDGWLISTSVPNSRDDRQAIDRIDVATGDLVESLAFAGKIELDEGELYASVRGYGPGNALVVLDPSTSEVLRSQSIQYLPLIAVEDGVVYLSNYRADVVYAYDAQTLEQVRTYRVPDAGGVLNPFGFVAPGVLMLNGLVSLDVATGDLLRDPSEGEVDLGFGPSELRLPQGHPLED